MHRPIITFIGAVSLLLVSTTASAQEDSSSAETAQGDLQGGSAEGSAAPASPSEAALSSEVVPSAAPVWKRALTHYELGDSAAGLKLLKTEVHRCTATEGACSEAEIGTLYACVGIILSGGEKNHQGGVTAFRKALSLDSEIVLLSVYQTHEVKLAFDEAKTGKRTPAPSAPQTQVPAGLSALELERREQHALDLLKKRGILFVTGTGAAGSVNISTYDGNYDFDYTNGLGRVGGSVTVGGMPGRTSGFTMGGRARGGVYLTERNPIGHVGASAVLGSTIGKRQDDQFAYFLGGFGFDYVPVAESIAMAFSFQGGASLGGFLLGGTMDLTAGTEVVTFLLGVEIGYGTLL